MPRTFVVRVQAHQGGATSNSQEKPQRAEELASCPEPTGSQDETQDNEEFICGQVPYDPGATPPRDIVVEPGAKTDSQAGGFSDFHAVDQTGSDHTEPVERTDSDNEDNAAAPPPGKEEVDGIQAGSQAGGEVAEQGHSQVLEFPVVERALPDGGPQKDAAQKEMGQSAKQMPKKKKAKSKSKKNKAAAPENLAILKRFDKALHPEAVFHLTREFDSPAANAEMENYSDDYKAAPHRFFEEGYFHTLPHEGDRLDGQVDGRLMKSPRLGLARTYKLAPPPHPSHWIGPPQKELRGD